MDPAAQLIVERIDGLLRPYESALGDARQAYRNHACRAAHFCLSLAPASVDREEKIAITAAFHDLGIWTAGTFDYLEPSVRLADGYLRTNGRPEWTQEIAATIRAHHKVTTAARLGPLADAFRRADWADVTRGLLARGIPRDAIREAYARFPSLGFHRRLVALTWRQARAHPTRPLPMVRW